MDVWPFVPQSSLRESMEWKTEVIRCRAAEQRLCLRSIPRVYSRYEYQMLPQQMEAATVIARSFGADSFYLPIWQDLDYVGTVASAETTINVDTASARYTAGGYAFVIGQDNRYEIVTIQSVDPGSITLEDPGILFGYTGAVVMPCYLAQFSRPFSMKKRAAQYVMADAEFVITVPINPAENNTYPAYNGSYVMTDRPLVSGGDGETQTREKTAFQNIAGPIFYSKNYTYAVGASALSWSFNDRAEKYAFLEWMMGVKGKQESFYQPRWTRDFVLDADVSSSDQELLVLTNQDREDSYIGHICVAFKDGSQLYLEILSWEYFGPTRWQMNLTAPVGQNFTVSEVELITRMPKMRLDSDRIEFSHKGSGVVDVSLPIFEVPE